MTLAFQFPGQGAVFPGMGADLAAAWPEAAAVYRAAREVTGLDLLDLAASASRERLGETGAAHLLTFTHSLAVHRVLAAAGVEPDVCAGHSLGHLAALAAAGALGLEEGLALAALRGRLLAACCRRHPGGMLAVRGLPLEEVETALNRLRGDGALVVGAVNGRDEIVVSGDAGRISDTLRELKKLGGAATPLAVAGAFHSPRMVEAARELATALAGLPLRDPVRPVVSTLSGEPLATAAGIRRDLLGHLLSPVRWDRVLATLEAGGTRIWIEVGPGKALTGLARRWDRRAAACFTGSTGPLRALVDRLGREHRTLALEASHG